MAADEQNGAAYAANLREIRAAAERIKPYAHVTPVMTCQTLDTLAGCKLFFKCENLQRCGAFKFRGAMNSVLSLSDEEAACGVVTHSSGNHAAALACAAKLRGIPAYIIMPTDAPQVKAHAVEGYGGLITWCEPSVDARESAAAAIQQKTGATLVPPYNYGPTICGQGTMALELLEQVPHLDAIVVPICGGGMTSGIAIAAKGLKPDIRIIAAEPTGLNDAADVAASIAAGHLVKCEKPITIADGLRGRMGDLTWPIVRDFVDEVVTVSEKEIVDAMQLCFERMKLVVEPSGAVGLAAVLSPQFQSSCGRLQRDMKHLGIILSGGNVELAGLWDKFLIT
ncbi:Serine racemase [Coccomyxa sp. Obi]|nr:Serine racemase [Coccomyxa sp. Obi]